MPTQEMEADRHEHGRLRDRVAHRILGRPDVAPTVAQAQAAGIGLPAIIVAILPIVVQYLLTGTLDIPAILAAIKALFQK